MYGYFALTFITPNLQKIFPNLQVFNALSGAIVVGIMVLPMIATLSDNALRAVPHTLREGGYALGATSFEVTTQVVMPAGLSGVMASFILAISRAIGETMAVTLAAGATPNISLTFFESVQTYDSLHCTSKYGRHSGGGRCISNIVCSGSVVIFSHFIAQHVFPVDFKPISAGV